MPSELRRLLLIVNNPVVRGQVQGAFISRGWEVAMAATEAEGVALAGGYDPNWVVFDPDLPDGDGRSVVRAIEAMPNRPRLALIAGADGASADFGVRPDVVVRLPVRGEELYRICSSPRPRPEAADQGAVLPGQVIPM